MYKDFLRKLYEKYNLLSRFDSDYDYLTESIEIINDLWIKNSNTINIVRLVILAESPMWGDNKRYFYNPNSPHSQFFWQSDLEYVMKKQVTTKKELIQGLNNLGVLILDLSPFPFNPLKTGLSYKSDHRSKKIQKTDYIKILDYTQSEHLYPKLEKIKVLAENNDISKIKFCFRYERVKHNLEDDIKEILISNGFKVKSRIDSISMKGGGIFKKKLREIILGIV